MAEEATDNFVEIDGVKYEEDPDKEGQALMGEDNQLVPFKEKEEETDEEKEAREKKGKEDQKKDEEEEPLTRKSAKDYIIERKQKKIEKLEKKKEEGGETGDGGEEEVTSAGKKAIETEIDKKVKPILQTVRTQADEQELETVLKKYSVDEKTEKQIRKYMEHDAYKDVSVEFIFLGLAAKKMKLQEKREKADEDAKGDITGGHEKRKKNLGPIPDVRDMDDTEVDKLVFKVKTGQL